MAIDAVFMRALDDVRGEPNGLTKNKHKRTLTRFVPPFNELSYNWLGEKWAIKREKSWLTERELLLGKIMAVNCYAAALLLFFVLLLTMSMMFDVSSHRFVSHHVALSC